MKTHHVLIAFLALLCAALFASTPLDIWLPPPASVSTSVQSDAEWVKEYLEFREDSAIAQAALNKATPRTTAQRLWVEEQQFVLDEIRVEMEAKQREYLKRRHGL